MKRTWGGTGERGTWPQNREPRRATNGSYDYVVRWAYLDRDLLGDGDLHDQAATLARWIDDAFSELRDAIIAPQSPEPR